MPGKSSKVLKIVGAIVLLPVGLVAVWYYTTDVPSHAKIYASSQKEAKDLGLFFTTEEIDAIQKVPENERSSVELPPARYTLGQELLPQWEAFAPDFPTLQQALKGKYIRTASGGGRRRQRGGGGLKVWNAMMDTKANDAIKKSDFALTEKLLSARNRTIIIANDRLSENQIGSSYPFHEDNLAECLRLHSQDSKWVAMVEKLNEEIDLPYDFLIDVKYAHARNQTMVKAIHDRDKNFENMVSEDYRKIPSIKEANFGAVHSWHVQLAKIAPPFKVLSLEELEATLAKLKAFDAEMKTHFDNPRSDFAFMPFKELITDFAIPAEAMVERKKMRERIRKAIKYIKDNPGKAEETKAFLMNLMPAVTGKPDIR